jgi:hypothetical protein
MGDDVIGIFIKTLKASIHSVGHSDRAFSRISVQSCVGGPWRLKKQVRIRSDRVFRHLKSMDCIVALRGHRNDSISPAASSGGETSSRYEWVSTLIACPATVSAQSKCQWPVGRHAVTSSGRCPSTVEGKIAHHVTSPEKAQRSQAIAN